VARLTPTTHSPTHPPANATAAERHSFTAETGQLLNIVANSLYTDKHVFIRELVSNASDACEKARHVAATGAAMDDPERALEVRVMTDDKAGTITIADTGIGMDKSELIENLGTIARSGSRAFLAKLQASGGAGGAGGASGTGANIIGQFGVGFYSAFMVAESVTVYSRSATPGATGWVWTSRGDGAYDIAPAAGVERGTRVVITLKDTCKEFAAAATVKDIITRHSSFVSFPIKLNGSQLNTVGALWARSKSDITDAQYTEFYKFKSGDFEPPLYRLHFEADAPIVLKALLFVGASHDEKFGMGRLKPGVDLYSRRVLIEAGSRIMPDWLRFVHGVVDSEDIPLNISRESMQDSALMKRLRAVLTRRVLRFLEAEARRDPEAYAAKFFPEFGTFLKEGAVSDTTYGPEIARLLRFESSQSPAGKLVSLDEYVSRMSPGQADVYYLVAPHRGVAEASPYMEAFKAAGVEVLFLYSPLDDFVMNNLREVNGRKLVTAETAGLDPAKLKGAGDAAAAAAAAGEAGKEAGSSKEAGKEEGASADVAATPLTEAQVEELGKWFTSVLPKRVSKLRVTTRLRSSPAVVTDHESAAVRRMMRMVEQSSGRDSEATRGDAHLLPPQTLEVNPSHPVMVKLFAMKDAEPALALLVAEQVLDNALIAAGLVDDARTMLPRLNALLSRVAGLPTAFTSTADVAAKRFTSPREADERAGIDASRTAVDEMVARTASGGAAAGPGAASGGGDADVRDLEAMLKGMGIGAGGAPGADGAAGLDAMLDEARRAMGDLPGAGGSGKGRSGPGRK